MSEEQLVAMVQAMLPDMSNISTETIQTYLMIAQQRMLNAMYPFGGAPSALPSQYQTTQCELAVRMIARQGGEGEVGHSENGVVRTYGNIDDSDILQRLTPMIGVFSSAKSNT